MNKRINYVNKILNDDFYTMKYKDINYRVNMLKKQLAKSLEERERDINEAGRRYGQYKKYIQAIYAKETTMIREAIERLQFVARKGI